jgi:hypothetical protein
MLPTHKYVAHQMALLYVRRRERTGTRGRGDRGGIPPHRTAGVGFIIKLFCFI